MSSVLVVGAGVIGTTLAYELQRRGRTVTLVDREAPGTGASYGNMACIAVTEFMPASRPGIWAQMPKWLLAPEGPVSFRLSYASKLLPWSMRYILASRPSKLRNLEAAGAALCKRVHEDFGELLRNAGLGHVLSAEGCICIFKNEQEFAADRDHIEIVERFGFRHELLDANGIRELEPSISSTVAKAILLPDNRTVADPFKLVVALAERFQALGGVLVQGEVAGFEQGAGGVASVLLRDGRSFETDDVVLAAGAYTTRLSRALGDRISLETERGYHTQIESPGISMRHSILWPARAFMITPTAGGIRVGGTVEMAGLKAALDYRRARVLVKHAKEALPQLDSARTSEWMGHRPATPDTIPIIGRSAKQGNVWYATGHGHLGLTYAATTARLIGDLMDRIEPPLDMSAYSVERF